MQYEVHDANESKSKNASSKKDCLQWDDGYVRRSWHGRLKILEIIATLISAASLPTDETGTRSTFLRVIAWTAFTVAVLDLVLHLSKLWEKVHDVFKGADVQMTFAALTGFFFLLSSGLLADVTPSSKHVGRTTLSFAAGFFAAAFYGIEALLHFLLFRQTDPKFPPNTEFSVVM